MAQVHDRKSNLYSQKQSIREELSAPKYLESAGDELIKRLAKKQTNTSTSLQEQLEIVQNFEKGFELNPDNRKGVASLEDFKKHAFDESETSISSTKREDTQDVNELMKITGLTRHELELGLCEKPSSTASQLYMFAMRHQRQKEKHEDPQKMLYNHPINHLKEIEEEYFGEIKSRKRKSISNIDDKNQNDKIKNKSRKKKKRKRRKKNQESIIEEIKPSTSEGLKNSNEHKEKEQQKSSSIRPSLWDVKDMKKWSEVKKIGCKPQTFYTIKNGKIIKLEKECVGGGNDEGEETRGKK